MEISVDWEFFLFSFLFLMFNLSRFFVLLVLFYSICFVCFSMWISCELKPIKSLFPFFLLYFLYFPFSLYLTLSFLTSIYITNEISFDINNIITSNFVYHTFQPFFYYKEDNKNGSRKSYILFLL